MLLRDVEREELHFELAGEVGGVRWEGLLSGTDGGGHRGERVGRGERVDAGGGDGVGVGVEFGAGGHLVAKV